MSSPLQPSRPTTSNQEYNPFIDFQVSLFNSDSFLLENRESKDPLKESETSTSSPLKRPKVVRPIPIKQTLIPELATVASDIGSVNLASPSLIPSIQEFMVFSADSAPSLEKRVSKRSREETETPTSSPIKRPRVEQQPMVPVFNSQLPTSTFGDVNSAVSRYSGNYKDGLYHGFGTLISANGDTIYTGYFRYGIYHGNGTLIYQNGASYIGEFRRGAFHGYGSLIYPNGTSYIGQFRNGAFHGQGVFQSGNFTASGEFQNNLLHGHGTAVIKDFQFYIGNFSNGFFHGYGKLSYANGVSYEGALCNNLYHGQGKLTCLNGMLPLIGEFRLGNFQQPSYILQ